MYWFFVHWTNTFSVTKSPGYQTNKTDLRKLQNYVKILDRSTAKVSRYLVRSLYDEKGFHRVLFLYYRKHMRDRFAVTFTLIPDHHKTGTVKCDALSF